jgi:redox-sensitive bicupin YhaK (pirin superfamily)
MLVVRRDADIYRAQADWFQARWHFSFDRYRDPENDGIGPLRVFNDDRLAPGAIWPLHPHKDVEGLTYVVEGLFRHEDNVGGAPGPLPAGSVQRMTLGRGAWHSEQNASPDEEMRFIQIWILPTEADLEPAVEQKVFTTGDRTNRLLEVFNPEGSRGAVKVHGDARVFVSRLEQGVRVRHGFAAGRAGYLYLIAGDLQVGEEKLSTGDAVKVFDEPAVDLVAGSDSELILVDVPTEYRPVGIWAR